MSRFDDDQDMEPTWDERLLAGDLAQDEPELTAVISAVRAVADAPPPPPSAALRQLLRDGLPESVEPPSENGDELAARRRLRDRRGVRRGLRIAVAAMAAGVVATGAAALEPMPEAIREPARALVTGFTETFTPWSGPRWSDEVEPGKRANVNGGTPNGSNGDGADGEGGNGDGPADGGSTGGGPSGEEQGPVRDDPGTSGGQEGSSGGSGDPGKGAGAPADTGTSGSPTEQGTSPDPGSGARTGDASGQTGTVGDSGAPGEGTGTVVSAP